ncbi:MAG: DegQ family serine endoprotease [Candidatus Korobacteraceae bacterium]
MTRNLRKPSVASLLLVVVALAVGVVAGTWIAKRDGVPITVVHAQTRAGTDVPLPIGFHSVVERVAPAVVNISTSRTVQTSQKQIPPSMEGFFQDFFGGEFGPHLPVPRERQERSLGSGVIVSADGYVLTNNHVIEGADEIIVAMAGGKELKAELVGGDPMTDLAVLRVKENSLPTVTLGRSSDIQVGDFALALGNPFGLGQTVTQGIVSATGRGGLGIEEYEDFLQTDAAINPGNSGGALVNSRGELVGINTAILSRAGGFQGVGFAIPVDMAQGVMRQLIQHGEVTRGYIGATVQEVTPEIAKVFGLKEARGVLIGDVEPSGPAAQAGIRRGDILLSMNGQPVEDVRNLRLRIAEMQPGTQVAFQVWRDGREIPVNITLTKLPMEQADARTPGGSGDAPAMLQGLDVQDLTAEIAQQLGLSGNVRGVVVSAVAPGSAAAEAGLRRGDVIQEVNRKPVSSVQEFRNAVQQGSKQPVLLLVNTGGTTRFVVLRA